ncbi:MAG: hypothetical protein MUC87_08245 [Bacteroidia bacterium]|jgi:hypothetical protein|nr:hypothetical protein [Bacteroidia bacterium]
MKTLRWVFFCICISHTLFAQKETTDKLIASLADEICQYYTPLKISDTSNWEKRLSRAIFQIAADNNPSFIRLQQLTASGHSVCDTLLVLQEKIVRQFHAECPAGKYIPQNRINNFCLRYFKQKKIIDTINDGTLYNYYPMLDWIVDSLKKQTTQNLFYFFDNHAEGKKFKPTFDTISEFLIKNKIRNVLIAYSLITRDSSLQTQHGVAISFLQISDTGGLICQGQIQFYFYFTYTIYKIADCRLRSGNEISESELKKMIPPPPPPPPPMPSPSSILRGR